METEFKDMDFFLEQRTIGQPNINYIIDYFDNGKGNGIFDKLEFLNLLWDKLEFINTNKTNPQTVFDDLSNLELTDNKTFTLFGIMLYIHGGSPVCGGDADKRKILKWIEDKIRTDYSDEKYDKSFFTDNIESLIPQLKSGFLIDYWENNKCGNFEFDRQISLLYFREADIEYPHSYIDGNGDIEWIRNKMNHITATGFIVHLLRNFGKQNTDIYDSYYNRLEESYVNSENRKPGAHKRNLKDEFCTKHILEEKERSENSKALFDYLKESDKKEIQSYIDDYFEYIKKEEPKQIGECTKESEQSEDDGLREAGTKLKRIIDEEKLKPYFISTFKGMGNGNINFFSSLIEELKTDREAKEFAQIALMIFESSKTSDRVGNVFTKWYTVFCECVGCEKKTYKPKDLRSPSESLKKLFNYL